MKKQNNNQCNCAEIIESKKFFNVYDRFFWFGFMGGLIIGALIGAIIMLM